MEFGRGLGIVFIGRWCAGFGRGLGVVFIGRWCEGFGRGLGIVFVGRWCEGFGRGLGIVFIGRWCEGFGARAWVRFHRARAYHFEVSDDGTLALVEFVARDRSAFKALLADSTVTAFLRGQHDLAGIVAAFTALKKDFDINSFRLAAM